MCPTSPSFVCSSIGLNHYNSPPLPSLTKISLGSKNMCRTVASFLFTLNGVPVSTTFFSTMSSVAALVSCPMATSARSSSIDCLGLNSSSGHGR